MTSRVSKQLLFLEQWSRGIAEVSTVQGTDRFMRVLLAAVKRLVDFDFLMAFAYGGRARPLILGDTLDTRRNLVFSEAYVTGPFLLDPFFQLVEQGQLSGCFRLRDVAPDHFRRSEYFRVHYGRTGIGEEIGIFFDLGNGRTGVTSFVRWDRSPLVVRAEFDILRAMEPVIGALCARHWSNLHGVSAMPAPAQRGPGLPDFPMLTAREREIVTMILRGHSTESIALQLGISPGTVKIHRKNIYRKMRVSTQGELFAAVMGFSGRAGLSPAYSPGDMDAPVEIPHAQGKSR